MSNYQDQGPQYVNRGFENEEGRPPPYAPQGGFYPSLPLDTPSYVVSTPTAINTQHTVAPGTPQNTAQREEPRRCQRKHIISASLCVFLILAVASILLWYFLSYQCLIGRSCRKGGKCLSTSQWCDGVKDCSEGEDESQCFRLHGTSHMLQSYSSHSQTWMPVCAENWSDDYGKAVCEEIGYRRQYYVSSTQVSAGSMASAGYMKLSRESTHGPRVQSQLIHSQRCSTRAVSLQCIECGKSQAASSPRIVGGTEAVNGAWPWQVSLQINSQHICGASIITPYWIVSAAHCFQSYSNPDIWTVHSGDVHLFSMSFYSGHAVDRIINHESYNRETNDNDIALLRLKSPLRFSGTVKPVCLPNIGMDLRAGRQAWITGWGALHSGGLSPDTLNQAQVTIYSRDSCNRHNILNGDVTETMICAGKLQGGVDSCQGDSGGPLVVKEEGLWWLVGDTSWGIGCAWRNKPGVYGNVTYFIDWIYEQLQKQL